MRILVLGGNGMLGSQVVADLRDRFDIVGLCRSSKGIPEGLTTNMMVRKYDIRNFQTVSPILSEVNADIIINCVGLVKQRTTSSESDFVAVNSLFPHLLAECSNASQVRIIHISTDCVFSGKNGPYKLEDIPDPIDTYGRSKLLGELSDRHCLTLRTSFIGHEFDHRTGLLEWFLSQRGQAVNGYTRALYSGLTALEVSKFLARVIADRRALHGIWHLASEPISKYDLLCLIRDVYEIEDIDIRPDDSFVCDRRLDGSPLADACGYRCPGWRQMIEEMYSSVLRADAEHSVAFSEPSLTVKGRG